MVKRKRPGSSPATNMLVVVSYGVLLYKIEPSGTTAHNGTDSSGDDDNNNNKEELAAATREESEPPQIRFLLGLIPQGNWWTVFKGLPNGDEERPLETALREFQEETGTDGLLAEIRPELTLHGQVGSKKRLEIYLQEGSHVAVSDFSLEKVVKIDQGYMQGRPEIKQIQWLTLTQAMEGVQVNGRLAKIYKSQQDILRQAHEFLSTKYNHNSDTHKTSRAASVTTDVAIKEP